MKLADLLGKKVEKKKEKEVLMNYQKTRNYREKEKMEKRVQKKREASKKRYLEKYKDKLKKREYEIQLKEADIEEKMKILAEEKSKF